MSKILVLTISSNRKVETKKVSEYHSHWGVGDFLPENLVTNMFGARRRIHNLIMSDEVSRRGS